MGSRKEEERNEKIIRGLMKLPPNRRCINCNSLGPQYVCTNFWTIVCITCSGIHREFTHCVKSVSMAKFTSQEVDALQNGGNQRAREIYLKNWDIQRQRLPDNSNVDKIREFIRNVYVDQRYAAAKSYGKPPRDVQRTTSMGSIDSNLSSLRSCDSGGLVDFFSKPVQASGSLQNKACCVPQPFSSDIYKAPVGTQPFSSSASSVDLFQVSEVPQVSSVDLFQSYVLSGAPSFAKSQPTQTSQSSSVHFFADLAQQSAATSDVELSIPKNEGWASFDAPQYTTCYAQVETPAAVPSTADSSQERFVSSSNFNTNMQWPSFDTSSVSVPSVTSKLWHDDDVRNGEHVSVTATITQLYVETEQPWNAFEDSVTPVPVDAQDQKLQLQNLPSTDDKFLDLSANEGLNKGGTQGIAPVGGFHDHVISSHFVSGSPNLPSSLPPVGEIQPNGINRKSTNPFDYPYDSDVEHNNMFLDISSLQAALPDSQIPLPFYSGIAEPWLPQNTVTPYISAGQGGLTFMAAQPSSQIP